MSARTEKRRTVVALPTGAMAACHALPGSAASSAAMSRYHLMYSGVSLSRETRATSNGATTKRPTSLAHFAFPAIDSYRRKTTPVGRVMVCVSFTLRRFLSGNSRLPPPSTSGYTCRI